MIETIYARPAKGLKVRFEEIDRGYIPEDGATVPTTMYYRRQVRDGSLIVGTPPRPKAKEAA